MKVNKRKNNRNKSVVTLNLQKYDNKSFGKYIFTKLHIIIHYLTMELYYFYLKKYNV